jgi:hypothetical protein
MRMGLPLQGKRISRDKLPKKKGWSRSRGFNPPKHSTSSYSGLHNAQCTVLPISEESPLCHDAGVEDAVHRGLQQLVSVPVTTHKVQSLIKLNPAPLPSPKRVKGSSSPSRLAPTPGSGWLSLPCPGVQQICDRVWPSDTNARPPAQSSAPLKVSQSSTASSRVKLHLAELSVPIGWEPAVNAEFALICSGPMLDILASGFPHPAAPSNLCRVTPPGPADR